MTLKVPEDSYVNVLEADAYHSIRQSAEVWSDFTDVEKERRLVSASDWLDMAFEYRGNAIGNRAWPRMIDGAQTMPTAVRYAVFQAALSADISGGMPDAKNLRQIGGGILLEDGKCDGDCENKHHGMGYVYALLKPFIQRSTMIPVPRG